MDVKLYIDGKEIELNQFTKKIFSGIIAGAVTSLRGVKEDWREIQITVNANDKQG